MAKYSLKVHGEAAQGAQAHGGGGGRALTEAGVWDPFLQGLGLPPVVVKQCCLDLWLAGGVGEWEEVFGALGALGVAGFLTCLKLWNFTYGF